MLRQLSFSDTSSPPVCKWFEKIRENSDIHNLQNLISYPKPYQSQTVLNCPCLLGKKSVLEIQCKADSLSLLLLMAAHISQYGLKYASLWCFLLCSRCCFVAALNHRCLNITYKFSKCSKIQFRSLVTYQPLTV